MFRRAIIISGTIPTLVTLMIAFFFGKGTNHKMPKNPQEFDSLSYAEQQAWLSDNGSSMTGLEFIQTIFSDPILFTPYLQFLVQLAITCFICCLLMAVWQNKK